jgi:hypothetical protein
LGVVFRHLAQQKTGRPENSALIKPRKVSARLRTLLASLPDRDSCGAFDRIQTAGLGIVHRGAQPTEVVRDALRPSLGRRSPRILVSSALRYPCRQRERSLERSDPIRLSGH